MHFTLLRTIFLFSFFILSSHSDPIHSKPANVECSETKEEKADCERKYQLIKSVLNQFKRPITVIEIGPTDGFFSFKVAREFDAVCVMANDPEYKNNELQKLCEKNDLDNIILLSKKMTPSEIKNLSDCEHFDVVLVLNGFKDFGKDWRMAFRKIALLGDHIFVALPEQFRDDNSDTLSNYVNKWQNVVMGEFSNGHTGKDKLHWIFNPKKELRRKGYCLPKTANFHKWAINSDFEDKKIEKYFRDEFIKENRWVPGINLLTFKFLNGTYPSKKMMKESIRALANTPSNDWLPHNMIVQGKKCALIDCSDPHLGIVCKPVPFSADNLVSIENFIDENDTQKLKHFHLLPR